ncbi:MAG: response regulator transcription factor [Myxococcota bacterium]|nr:response regulator transcription factor [Myxococcota bacterium]
MDKPARILVIEDDETIALGIVTALRQSYEVEHFDTGEAGLEAIRQSPPQILLLDVMLPGMDGLTVLRTVKAEHPSVQVIMLTARNEELDRVLGLEMGADDYVTKPFSLRELLARVKARLRSAAVAHSAPETTDTPDTFSFGTVEVDLRRRIVIKDGQELRLTTHEGAVLAYLIAHRGRAVSREELLEQVWGYTATMTTRTVDNQILKLRKKLEEVPSDPRHILTVHRTGYRFEA